MKTEFLSFATNHLVSIRRMLGWQRALLLTILLVSSVGGRLEAQVFRDSDSIRITRDPPAVVPEPKRPFEVNPSDTRRPPAPMKGTDKVKPVDKNKIKSLFDKAKEPPPQKQSSGSVSTQTATGKSKAPETSQRKDRRPAKKPEVEEEKRQPMAETPPPGRGLDERLDVLKREDEKLGSLMPPPTTDLPTIKAEDMIIGPQIQVRPFDPELYQQVPGRPGVELPKGGAQLPGTGLPGKDGIGGLQGGFQGGLNRPVLDHNTGEERYEQNPFGGSDPATDPSGALGDAGGVLGAAGQAYGGKGGKTMEQVGGLLQSESGAQAVGRGADILLPGSGGFVESAAKGDTGGMVKAGATAAGNLASDLAIGLIIGFVGGGLLGMAVGYILSATGAGRYIADSVSAGVTWVAEKLGIGGSTPEPAQPEPEPEPPPDSEIYDENHSKGGGKKGPSVINENQIRPLQDQLNEDLLGEKRDAEEYVDTSDAPPPGKVAVGPGCDPENLSAKGGGTINTKDPLQIKDMEKPGYDKY